MLEKNYLKLKELVNERCNNCIVSNPKEGSDFYEADGYIHETYFIVRKNKKYDWGVRIGELMEAGFIPSHIQTFNGKDELCVKIKTPKNE